MGGVLERLLDMEPLGRGRFVGGESPDNGDRVFGGQFLGQALAAAQCTVDEDRPVHSLHGYFLGAGDPGVPIEYSVEELRDGRSFSQRQVTARHGDRLCFTMLASFHVPEDGLDHDPWYLPEVPGPDLVTVTYDQFNRELSGHPDEPWYGESRPIDIRYITVPTAPEGEPITEPQLMWVRIDEELPDDPRLHAAALAYLSDSTLVDHVALPHGRRWQDARLTGASLDHVMWFHRPGRADRWLLFDQRVESTSAARGTAIGRLLTADGTLLATCGQEGLMRWS
jgi:acyl-CoA thioesterase-2